MEKLTEKEFEVLKLLQKGYSNNEIASELFVTIHTVKAHVSSIIKKLNAKNRVNAIYIALNKNLV